MSQIDIQSSGGAAAGVSSLNGLTGAVTLSAGANITLTPVGNDISIASVGAGTGDVVGPAGATDNAIARYDTATGKLIQNSAAFVDDTGNITGNNLSGTHSGSSSGTNTGDQTSIVGITGTKAQFDTACTDGNFLYVGDITQYTDEMAQDAVGTILTDTAEIDFTYNDAANTITAALVASSIDEAKLDASVNASLALANSAAQLSFTTIAVSGQSNVVADSNADTLTLVAGTNVTITTNAATDAITITAASGSGSFAMTETEIDFGTTPVRDKTFTVTDGTVTGSSKIAVWPSGNVGTSRVGNDLEWDNLLLGALAGTGQFTLTALALPGPIVGKRKVYYAVA
jgi:hypothetical protein